MLLVASPIWNTVYSSRLSWPLRAPTIRSVPLMVLVKDWRISVRRYWMPSSRDTLRVRVRQTRASTRRRYQMLAVARERASVTLLMGSLPKPVGDGSGWPAHGHG